MSNTSPVALNDFLIINEDSSQNAVDPRANDFILPSNPALYYISSLPTNGTLEVSVQLGDELIAPVLDTPYDGPMVYTPNSEFVGSDIFTYYVINDLAEQSNTGVVTFTVRSLRPDGPTDWATSLLNNGPLNGPNRIDPTVDRQQAGWAWGDRPDFETLNGWMYNMSNLLKWSADSVDRLDTDVTSISFTNNQTWTIGANDATEKTMFAGSTQLLNPYISFKADAEGTLRWIASDTGNPETEYNLEHPVTLTEDDVLALIIAHDESTEASGGTSMFFDLRPNGILTSGQALSIASAQNPNPSQGDLMAIQFNFSQSYYYGNGTSTRTVGAVNNYIFSSGAWTGI